MTDRLNLIELKQMIDAIEDENIKKSLKEFYDQRQKEVEDEYEQKASLIIDGYNSAIANRVSQDWIKTNLDSADMLTSLAKSSNPIANGKIKLEDIFITAAGPVIGNKIKGKSSIFERIKHITDLPFVKNLITSNPVLSSVSQVVSELSKMVGNRNDQVSEEEFVTYKTKIGNYVAYFESLSLINTQYIAEIDEVKRLVEALRLKMNDHHRQLPALLLSRFDSEQNVPDFNPQSDTLFSDEISSQLYNNVNLEDKYNALYVDFAGSNFEKAILIAQESIELAKETGGLKERIDAATTRAKLRMQEVANKYRSEPDVKELLMLDEVDRDIEVAYKGLFMDEDCCKLKVFKTEFDKY